MKTFDKNYKLLKEMYQDGYFPDFLVDKVKAELQKVIDLLEKGRRTGRRFRRSWTKRSAPSMTCRRSSRRTTVR